jgi:hypothetical protein
VQERDGKFLDDVSFTVQSKNQIGKETRRRQRLAVVNFLVHGRNDCLHRSFDRQVDEIPPPRNIFVRLGKIIFEG